jgi:hypothetical protein
MERAVELGSVELGLEQAWRSGPVLVPPGSDLGHIGHRLGCNDYRVDGILKRLMDAI